MELAEENTNAMGQKRIDAQMVNARHTVTQNGKSPMQNCADDQSIKGPKRDCSKSVQLSDRSQNLNFVASINLTHINRKCSG